MNITPVNLNNLNKLCRICLFENSQIKPIFEKLEESDILETGISTLAEEITEITSVAVNETDGFPKQVCTDCIALIHGAYKFKITYEYSYYLINQHLSKSNEVKDEEEEEIPDNNEDLPETDESSDLVENFTGQRCTSKAQIIKRSKKVESKKLNRRGRKAKTKSDSEEEEESSEKKSRLHPCPICTKEFSALELREHAHSHKGLKKYLSIPNEFKVSPITQFYKKYVPDKEVINIHNQKVKLHKCVFCGLNFTAPTLRIHLENHRNQKEYKCDQCERVFKKLNHLNTHRVKHLKEFPFKCEHCGKGFVIKKNYDCHILTHTNQELPHECSHCFKRFSNPEHLNRHIIVHTENVIYSVKYRVCKCHRCLKTFKDRAELKAHKCVPMEQVANTRYPCKLCNKVFKNSSGLYTHNRNIHKLKGSKILCSVCGNYVTNIYNHMMRHTGEKPFQCTQCGKRFVGKPQLRQHLLVHSGDKPYVCSVCAKRFNNLYNLQVHERIHKGDRCHVCNICSKGFLEKSYLKKHMNVHTKC